MGYSAVYDWVRLVAGVALVLTSLITTGSSVDWEHPCSGETPAQRLSSISSVARVTHQLEEQYLKETLDAMKELTGQLEIVKRSYRNTGRHNGRNERRACSRHPEHFAPPACWIISSTTRWQRLYLNLAQTYVYIDSTLTADEDYYEDRQPTSGDDGVHDNLEGLKGELRETLCALKRWGDLHEYSTPTGIRESDVQAPEVATDRYRKDCSVFTHLCRTLTTCGEPWVKDRLCQVQELLHTFHRA